MSNTTHEHIFVDNDTQALQNLTYAQGNIITILDGMVQELGTDEVRSLWTTTKALNSAVEVYCENR